MCCNRDCGCIIAVMISLFIAILVGVLFFFDFITIVLPIVWITFGLGVASLIGLVFLPLVWNRRENGCLCINGNCFLTGIFGSIITSIIALATTLVSGEVVATIIFALLVFFLILLLSTLIMTINCLMRTNCRFEE